MIKIENFEVVGWESAIRGMRNPMNSWEKSDSGYCFNSIACHSCKENRNNCKNNMESEFSKFSHYRKEAAWYTVGLHSNIPQRK